MEQLTLFPGDFLASHSVSQEKEKAQQTIDTSGQKLSGLYRKSTLPGSFLKTLLDSSPSWNPKVYLKWKSRRLSFIVRTKHKCQQKQLSDSSEELSDQLFQKSDQQDIYSPNLPMEHQSFCVFQLAPWERHTDEIVSGLLPTPVTTDHMSPKTDNALIKEMTITRPGRKQLSNLRDVVVRQPERLLPTPTANPSQRTLDPYGRNIDRKGNSYGIGLVQLAKAGLLPTPTATSDHKGGCTRPDPKRQNDSLAHSIHGMVGIPWKNFPVESPICGRDDGFSSGLVDISISKWRKEAIRSFGNAIVPQVAYQIFSAIHSIHYKDKNHESIL